MDKLGRDPKFVILQHSDPLMVLQMCQVDASFARVCSQPGVFERLLEDHFPSRYAEIENFDTAREAYNQFTRDLGLVYTLEYRPIPPEERDEERAYLDVFPVARYMSQKEGSQFHWWKALPENTVAFVIPDSKLPEDTMTALVSFRWDDEKVTNVGVQPFEILDDAIDTFMPKVAGIAHNLQLEFRKLPKGTPSRNAGRVWL